MMCSTMRVVSSLLCCRRKYKSSFIIAGMLILFIGGNYLLLQNFYDTKTQPTLEAPVMVVHQEDLFLEKFKKYEEQGEKGEEVGAKYDFNVRIEKKDKLVNELKSAENVKVVKSVTDWTLDGNMTLLVMACNRPSVGRCLDKLFKYKPSNVNIPVVVSQDCGHEPTANVIQSYGDKLIHIKQPDLGEVRGMPSDHSRFKNYYKISRHYKWALSKVFGEYKASSVVIVEDDIDIAPDFFEYFLATRPLLDRDPSIYCVSAWNDNGKSDSIDVQAIDLLYRTDFFPGLGWMLTRKLWNEISTKWTLGFWDDWMRETGQRKDRVCIRPEISRTKTFGRIGVSQGQFYDQYLKYIKLNENFYHFRDYDLDYLQKENYDEDFIQKVYRAPERHLHDVLTKPDDEEVVRITYKENNEFSAIARKLGIMKDFKAGVPRTAYMGIVSVFVNNKRIYISPPQDWKGYKKE